MQNIPINMCETFHYDRLRNDRALGNRKIENLITTKTPTTTTFVAIVDPLLGPKSEKHKVCTIWNVLLWFGKYLFVETDRNHFFWFRP